MKQNDSAESILIITVNKRQQKMNRAIKFVCLEPLPSGLPLFILVFGKKDTKQPLFIW